MYDNNDSDREEDIISASEDAGPSDDDADALVTKDQAKDLSQYLYKNIDLGQQTNTGSQDLTSMLAQRKLGLSKPLSDVRQARYKHLIDEQRMGTFLQVLRQPVDVSNIVDGKVQRCSIPLPLLVDPHSIHKSLKSVMPDKSITHLHSCVVPVEVQRKILAPLTGCETTRCAIGLARVVKVWDILTRLVTVPLGNCMPQVLDTPEKLGRWQEAVTAALSLISDEFISLDLLFQKRSDKLKVRDFQAGTLQVHLDRMDEYPLKTKATASSRVFSRTKRNKLEAGLSVSAMRKKEKEFLRLRVLDVRKYDSKFMMGKGKGRSRNDKRKWQQAAGKGDKDKTDKPDKRRKNDKGKGKGNKGKDKDKGKHSSSSEPKS